MPIDLTQGFRFGAFTAEPLKGSIAGDDGHSRHLAPKAMDVLVRLAEAAPRPVTREDLIAAVWGERYVSDEVVTHAIKELRHALDDSPTKPQYIQTIPKRGYQLLRKARPIIEPTPVREGRKRRYLAVAASLVLVFVALGWVILDSGQDDGLTDAADRQVTVSGITVNTSKSIAVLPFIAMSDGPDDADFADGLSEELRGALSHLPNLRVIARTSSNYFKDKDYSLSDIADTLRVAYVLEGSVRRNGDTRRISVHLVRTADDAQIWARNFDRILTTSNLFYVQSEIAGAVTKRLRISLTESDEKRLARIPTDNMDAYEAYLLGRHRLTDRKVEELADAVDQFALAIELDPQFAGAYSGLADACSVYRYISGGHGHEHCPSSPEGHEQLARKALELDPESGEAWVSLGNAIGGQAVRIEKSSSKEPLPKVRAKLHEAIAAFERGLELSPSLSYGYHWYGRILLMVQVYPDPPSGWIEAWQAGRQHSAFDRGLDVDPLSIPLHQAKTGFATRTRNKEEAMWHAHRIVEIAPDSPLGYRTVGGLEWSLNGRVDESIRWMIEALEADPQTPGFPAAMGRAYAALGDADMALAYFDLAKALTAPGNASGQRQLLVEQTMTRFVSGMIDVHQVADLLPPSSQPTSGFEMSFSIFADLATGRPADALARIEANVPECIGTTEISERRATNCPQGLVRVYQELGDHRAAQPLSDAIVRRAQSWVDGFPTDYWRYHYAESLATAGRTEAALDVLEDLVLSGWRGSASWRATQRFVLCCGVGLDAIRDHERFQAIVATIEADMAQQLENVRAMERRGEIPTLEEVNAMIVSETDSPDQLSTH